MSISDSVGLLRGGWKRPEVLLLLMAAAVPLSFATWQALLNNFAIERAAFTGAEIGILQSLREIPGFLAFTVVFALLVIKEQWLAYLALATLAIGTALTGWFPSVLGLYCTTVVMSVGFHYYETLQTSLSLQWLDPDRTAETLGRIIAAGSFMAIVTFGFIWLCFQLFELDFSWVYLIGGGFTLSIVLFAVLAFPHFPEKVRQRRHMVLRKRYWLYYVLIFLSGARRQIFIVFAGFLMVERFGFDVATISVLFLANAVLNVFFARRIGRLIGRWGERRALILEYVGLAVIFTAYAFVQSPIVAAGLYILDHMFFALAIAIKTYFQKIADPADIAATAGVGFTINHIAAVVIPAVFGLIWLVSPSIVFLCGTAIAITSLVFAFRVPENPAPGYETSGNRVTPLA